MNEEKFQLTKNFKSYVSKPEITDLLPTFLVRGSKNVLIDYAKRIVSRNGYELFGAESDGGVGIKSSYEWDTSTAKQFPIRTYGQKVEFYWNDTWNLLKTGFASVDFEWAKVWDNTEKIDVLLGVYGEANTQKWSGGVAKVASSSLSTLKKQGVLTSQTTIGFVAGNGTTLNPTITDSNNGFVTAGFRAGDTLFVTGSTNNNRNFTIASVAAGVITLIMSDTLTTEAAGASVTLHNGEATWAASRFLTTGSTKRFIYNGDEYDYSGGETTDTLTGVSKVNGTLLGNPTITIATPAVVTLNGHGLVAGSPIRFTTTGALPTGITAGTTYYVIATDLTANTFKFSATVGGSAVDTSGSQSGTHSLYSTVISVVAGDPVWQTMITLANPGAISTSFKQDLIGVQLGQVVLGSTKSQEIYGSAGDDYTDFTLTSPRAPGDPFKVNMDNYCTCIVPMDNQAQTINSLMFGGGTSDFFQLSFQMSENLSAELVRMIKLKTATGSGLVSKGAIGAIKNQTAYISREPSLDTLGAVEQVEGSSNLPISDAVKEDFDMYDFTDAHLKYWKRAIYIALPREGVVLIYDLMRKLWQPPQTIPVSRLAIIDDWLYGHSSVKNESYKLFTGTNDNGVFIPQVARFAYDNGGKRDRVKNMSEYWTDGYITGNGQLNLNLIYGFDRTDGYKTMPIMGSDTDIVTPQQGSPLGDTPLGYSPLGGAPLLPRQGLLSQAGTMLRFWQIDTVSQIDYVEYCAEYTMNTLDAQFAIVAHGSNQWDAGTVPVTHKK